MFSLNNHYNKIFVIHMKDDKDREVHIKSQFEKISTKYEFRRGVIPTNEERKNYTSSNRLMCSKSMLGIYLAHRYIWEEIVNNNIPNAVIFEDDVVFVEEIASVLPKAVNELPRDWELMYLGCITCCNNVSPIIKYALVLKGMNCDCSKPYSSHLRIIDTALGMEAYAISLEGAKKLLQMIPNASDHIDIMVSLQLKNLKAYSVYPLVAYQHESGFKYSNNNTKTPIILNQITSLIDIIILPHTKISLAYLLSVPMFQIHDKILYNGWCILFILLGFLSQWLYIILSLYLLIECFLHKSSNYMQYIFYLFCLSIGRMIMLMIFS